MTAKSVQLWRGGREAYTVSSAVSYSVMLRTRAGQGYCVTIRIPRCTRVRIRVLGSYVETCSYIFTYMLCTRTHTHTLPVHVAWEIELLHHPKLV